MSSMSCKRLASFFVISLTLTSILLVSRGTAQSQGCIQLPKITNTVNVPVEADYYAWVRTKAVDTTPPTIYLNVGGATSCYDMKSAQSKTTDWTWFSGAAGAQKIHLKAGAQTVGVYSAIGNLSLDSVIFTLSAECVPTQMGENCVEIPTGITVTGLSSGDIAASNTVEAFLSQSVLSDRKVEYYVDNILISSQTRSPYCLVTGVDGKCTSKDFGLLASGSHVLKVIVTAGTEVTEKNINFSTVRAGVPVNPNTPILSKDTPVVIGGSSKEQKVGGSVTLSLPSLAAPAPGSRVEYFINGKKVASKQSDSPEVKLDTTKLSNGEKIVSVVVTKQNGEKETFTSKIIVSNDFKTAFIGKARENSIVFSALSSLAAVAGYQIFKRLKYKLLLRNHNIDSNYSYTDPYAESFVGSKRAKLALVGVSIAIFGLSMYLLRGGAIASRAGIVIQPELGQVDPSFKVVQEPSPSTVKYVSMSYTPPPAVPNTSGDFSEENGYVWKPIRTGGGGNVSGVSSANDGTIVNRIDVYGGYVLDPGKTQWRQLITATSMPTMWSKPKAGTGIQEVAIAPSDSNRIYVQYKGHLLKSIDRGVKFIDTTYQPVPMNANGAYGRGFGDKMSVDPKNPDHIIAGAPTGVMRQSNDGGATWQDTSVLAGLEETKISQGEPRVFSVGHTGLAYDESSGLVGSKTKVAYAASWGRGIWRTSDGGTTWQQLPGSPLHVMHAGIDSSGDYFVIDGYTGQQLSIMKYSGGTWSNVSGPLNIPNYGIGGVENPYLAVDTKVKGHVVAGVAQYNGKTTFETNDSGLNWRAIDIYVTKTDVAWLTVDAQRQGYLVASDMIFDRSNSGRIWMAFGHDVETGLLSGTSSRLDFSRSTRGMESMVSTKAVSTSRWPIFGMYDFGVFYGTNNLDDWSFKKGPISTFGGTISISVSPFNADYVAQSNTNYTTNGNNPAFDASGYSADAGTTWIKFPTLPPGGPLVGFSCGAISVSSPGNIVWAPGYCSTYENAQPYYTKDGGQTWSPVNLPGVTTYPKDSIGAWFFRNRQTVTADTMTPGTFYLHMALEGVFKSVDGGATWIRVYNSTKIAESDDTQSKDVMVAAQGKAGVLYYTDGATGGNDYFGPDVNAGSSLMRSVNGGSVWSPIAGVSKVVDIGFGKAQAATGPASIYILGDVNGVYGVWRSVDDAATWQQIGKNTYGIDNFQSISGDMNTFGKVYVGLGGSSYVYGVPK
jgi:hypothetical protein